MKIDTLANEPAQASAGPKMEDAPTTGDGRMAGGHLGGRGWDPRVISKGETESNEEDVEEVIVTTQHNYNHQEDLTEEGEFSESNCGSKEEECEGNLNDEGGKNTEFMDPDREQIGSKPGRRCGQTLGEVVGGHGCQAPPGITSTCQL